jgi:5-methylcytosine-specific restriction enzyme A
MIEATRREQRSDAAKLYRRLYNTKRWRARRAKQLREHPLCAMCKAKGRTVLATVGDHVIPHRGDHDLFWYGELQSLCAPCHAHKTSVIEVLGWSDETGPDGYPLDPRHPWYRGQTK